VDYGAWGRARLDWFSEVGGDRPNRAVEQGLRRAGGELSVSSQARVCALVPSGDSENHQPSVGVVDLVDDAEATGSDAPDRVEAGQLGSAWRARIACQLAERLPNPQRLVRRESSRLTLGGR